ncbi:MAG: C-GCAxxG-C-C family protein [Candidatus Helarchaeota archaeon]
MSQTEDIKQIFSQKITELNEELPKKYLKGKNISLNCAMLTIKNFLEIIGREDPNLINMAGPLASITGECGAVNAGLMIVGLIIGKYGKQQIHQFKAATEGVKFLKHFRKKFNSIQCCTLTGGYNLLKFEEMEKYLRDKIWEKRCYHYVIAALEIIGKLYARQIAALL